MRLSEAKFEFVLSFKSWLLIISVSGILWFLRNFQSESYS